MSLTTAQVNAIVDGLGLQSVADPAGQRLLQFVETTRGINCISSDFAIGPDTVAHFAAGRPQQLRLGGGQGDEGAQSQFEYLLLYYSAAAGAGCVDFAYAYG